MALPLIHTRINKSRSTKKFTKFFTIVNMSSWKKKKKNAVPFQTNNKRHTYIIHGQY